MAEWFDNECTMKRREVRICFGNFRKWQSADSRQLGKNTKRCWRKRKKQYKDTDLAELLKALGNQQDFWKKINNLAPKRRKVDHDISIGIWYEHFKKVLETMHSTHDDVDYGPPESVEEMYLWVRDN